MWFIWKHAIFRKKIKHEAPPPKPNCLWNSYELDTNWPKCNIYINCLKIYIFMHWFGRCFYSKRIQGAHFYFKFQFLLFLRIETMTLALLAPCCTVLFEQERLHCSAVIHATHMTVASLGKDTGPAQSRWHVEGGRTTADQSAAFRTFLWSCYMCPYIVKANSHRFSPEGSLLPPSQTSKMENNPGQEQFIFRHFAD